MYLREELELERCPHCRISRPRLGRKAQFPTETHSGDDSRV